jgi:hypothetical protein
MTEIVEPRTLTPEHEPKSRRFKIKISDIIVFAIIIAAIVGLSAFLINRLTLKHDVNSAQVVADKTIDDLQKRDGTAARKLGSPTFQKTYSAAALTKQFQTIEVATLKPPKLERTFTFDSPSKGRTVFFVYKYTALKVPFYIRVGVGKQTGGYMLTQISGSADESKLVIE